MQQQDREQQITVEDRHMLPCTNAELPKYSNPSGRTFRPTLGSAQVSLNQEDRHNMVEGLFRGLASTAS